MSDSPSLPALPPCRVCGHPGIHFDATACLSSVLGERDRLREEVAGFDLLGKALQARGSLPEYPCCERVRRIEAVPGNPATLLGGACPMHGLSRRTLPHAGAGGGDDESYIHPDVLASQTPEFQAEYARRVSNAERQPCGHDLQDRVTICNMCRMLSEGAQRSNEALHDPGCDALEVSPSLGQSAKPCNCRGRRADYPPLDRNHPWAEIVAAAVRLVDSGNGGQASVDLIDAVRTMQQKAYGFVPPYVPRSETAEFELDAYADGRKHALGLVVKWLRATPGEHGVPWVDAAHDIADAIERGEHEIGRSSDD